MTAKEAPYTAGRAKLQLLLGDRWIRVTLGEAAFSECFAAAQMDVETQTHDKLVLNK